EAFYLGGTRSLRSVHGDTYGGTGLALARVDLIEMPDVLEVLHIPHPAMTPIQLAVFAATGSVWGTDPYGGASPPGGGRAGSRDLPQRRRRHDPLPARASGSVFLSPNQLGLADRAASRRLPGVGRVLARRRPGAHAPPQRRGLAEHQDAAYVGALTLDDEF